MRPEKDDYYLEIARAVSARSTCLRRKYGAVIVKDDEIVSTGYNGAPRGTDNCCDMGGCWRSEHKVPHGERYEVCRGVHAEQNAIISASREKMMGGTLYLVGFEDGEPIKSEPCLICYRMIINAGITKVVSGYGSLGIHEESEAETEPNHGTACPKIRGASEHDPACRKRQSLHQYSHRD